MRTLQASTRDLWTAYAVSAPIAPLSGAVLMITIVFAAMAFGVEINPAAAIVMPIAAVFLGVPAAYCVAGTLGMLIAFSLRRWQLLNIWSILSAAVMWSISFAVISPAFVGGDGVPASHYLTWVAYVLALTGPPTLLSALAFWLLVKRADQRLHMTGNAREQNVLSVVRLFPRGAGK